MATPSKRAGDLVCDDHVGRLRAQLVERFDRGAARSPRPSPSYRAARRARRAPRAAGERPVRGIGPSRRPLYLWQGVQQRVDCARARGGNGQYVRTQDQRIEGARAPVPPARRSDGDRVAGAREPARRDRRGPASPGRRADRPPRRDRSRHGRRCFEDRAAGSRALAWWRGPTCAACAWSTPTCVASR